MDDQTIVDSASRAVEVAVSHDGTVAGDHPGWFAGFIRWPCGPRESPPRPRSQQQLVDTTDHGHPDPNQLVQHMGGQFQKTPISIPPTLSSSDLNEPGAIGDNGEGASTEAEAYTIATVLAGHARQNSPVQIRLGRQIVPTQHAITPAQALVAARPSVGFNSVEGHSGGHNPSQPEPAYLAKGDSSIESGQHGTAMMHFPQPATR